VDQVQRRKNSLCWLGLSNFAAVNEDENLDMEVYAALLEKVENEIHSSQNRVRHTMNGFEIATGSYISVLTEKAKEVAASIGSVQVDMGETACKVPLAKDYIQKVVDKGRVGKRKKSARC
jgi:hypothetical protein